VRSRRRAVAAAVPTALVALVLATAGCGGEEQGTAGAPAPPPGAGGELRWALAERPENLDPLLAETQADQLVSRQIHEPLVEELSGPFGDTRRVPGLALSAQPSSDATVWRVRLRQGVRFQDGVTFDAAAVLANAERWRASPAGLRLLPGLVAVDAPRPDLVRFILAGPDARLDRRLADARLGIVSPRALRKAAGEGIDIAAATDSGTGPYELRERDADRLLVATNADWWGAGHELGPGIGQVEFVAVPDPDERLKLLRDGEVQVAGQLAPAALRRAAEDPLLTVARGGGRVIATERSVRGLADDPVPSLNSVWQTRIDAG
jgi:ABC-type transport system substrate-binding protein